MFVLAYFTISSLCLLKNDLFYLNVKKMPKIQKKLVLFGESGLTNYEFHNFKSIYEKQMFDGDVSTILEDYFNFFFCIIIKLTITYINGLFFFCIYKHRNKLKEFSLQNEFQHYRKCLKSYVKSGKKLFYEVFSSTEYQKKILMNRRLQTKV